LEEEVEDPGSPTPRLAPNALNTWLWICSVVGSTSATAASPVMVKVGFKAADTVAHGATMEAVTNTVAAWSWDLTRTGSGNFTEAVD
jgi:hypothetical protein